MNALFLVVLFLSGLVFSLNTFAAPIPESANLYSIAERGANHRVWQRVTLRTNQLGEVRSTTNSYTELETGMYYQKNGKWVETEAKIELTPNGASANQGAHKVNFAANINTVGAIDFTTADGKKMRSHVLGLSYFDTATGKSALIAEIKDSIGVLTPPNRVIYPDAFTDVKADIRYTYSKAGFEQDVILREQPPSPAEYGLNVDSTRLEILTEFVESPIPVIAQNKMKDKATGQTLRFGSMKMGPGIAFLTGAGDVPTKNVVQGREPSDLLPVSKQWMKMEGRTFLIESLKYDSIEPRVENLPKPEAKASSGNERIAKVNQASKKRILPVRQKSRFKSEKLEVASLERSEPGFLIDYELVSDSTDFTFQGDTTYYISGEVVLSGTVTIEGGAVIKLSPTNSAVIDVVDVGFDCKTDSYRPAVFTSRDDNTVGEQISGSTGTPTNYNHCFFIIATYPDLKHIRISYASTAISYWYCNAPNLSDVQFVKCQNCLTYNTTPTNSLRNVLFADCRYPFSGGSTVYCENVTINSCERLTGSTGGGTVYFTNSLAIALTNWGGGTIITNFTVASLSDVPGIFQMVGGGSFYLADNSPYRNVGTTNIDTNLLASLNKKTTYPPSVLTNTFTIDTTLSPRAQRDTDSPDLGYHYEALDYLMGNIAVSDAALLLTNGVAVGLISGSGQFGIVLQENSRFTSAGSPLSLNHIVRYNAVQEKASAGWPTSGIGGLIGTDLSSQSGEVKMRFTMLAGQHSLFFSYGLTNVSFSDCQFYGGSLVASGYYPDIGLWDVRNCLFSRAQMFGPFDAISATFYNNLFFGGDLELDMFGGSSFNFRDNFFDKPVLYTYGAEIGLDYNGYITNFGWDEGFGSWTPTANDVSLASFNFVSGPLGNFYQPTNSLLINAGSRNATNAGLYHFTITTDQMKETNSIVDIGFHYVAVDANGVPFDTDGDGDPDYHEDENGDGIFNNGESDWKTYESPAGLGAGTGLKVFTPLK